MAGLRKRGIGFRSLKEALDTTTPGGRLVFHVFAALAEFIRELIIEGLAAAKARGQRLGRPPAMTPEQDGHARALLTQPDATISSIAGLRGAGNNGPVSTATASSLLNCPGARCDTGWSLAWPERVAGVAGPLAALAALVSPGLPCVPGLLQLGLRKRAAAVGCRRPGTPGPARRAAGGVRPAGRAAPHPHYTLCETLPGG